MTVRGQKYHVRVSRNEYDFFPFFGRKWVADIYHDKDGKIGDPVGGHVYCFAGPLMTACFTYGKTREEALEKAPAAVEARLERLLRRYRIEIAKWETV